MPSLWLRRYHSQPPPRRPLDNPGSRPALPPCAVYPGGQCNDELAGLECSHLQHSNRVASVQSDAPLLAAVLCGMHTAVSRRARAIEST